MGIYGAMDDPSAVQGNTGAKLQLSSPPSDEHPRVRRRRQRATARKPVDYGGKTKLLTLDDLDRRTRAATRALDLQDKLISERGGTENLSALRVEVLRSVAVLSAMVEDLQARWLMGEKTDVAVISTVINARRREAELIGLDPLPRDVSPDLRDYLAGKRPGESVDSSAASSATRVASEAEQRTGESPNGDGA
jgi:hypothetical protein